MPRSTALLSQQPGVTLTTGYEVRKLERNADKSWRVTAEATNGGGTRVINAKFVFAGAGGGALPILQESAIPEADNYAGFPVGGSFLVSENPAVANRHLAKVYGKADVARRRCRCRISTRAISTRSALCCSDRSRPSPPSS
nr:malate:quinone oxidoreductase [Sphingomonas jeddahensis]